MRRAGTGLLAAGAGLAAIALLSGCSLAPNKELRSVVEASTPSHHEALDCSWGSSSGDDQAPSADYGCFYLVKGERGRIIRDIRARLAAGGFTVSRRARPHATALFAWRGLEGFCAQVVEQGFVLSHPDADAALWSPYARELAKSDDTPAGYVFVDLSAYRLGADELMPTGTACESPA